MSVTIQFETGNAAFKDDPGEVPRILRKVAGQIQNGENSGSIRDINGQPVGEYCFKEAI